MASFKPTIITTKGHALMAKIVAGTATPQFTNIATSSTDYSTLSQAQVEALTSITGAKQTLQVAEVKKVNEASVKISAALNNNNLTTGYYLKTIALYAADPDEGDILYSVTAALESDWIPPNTGVSVTSILIDLITVVSNADNVSIEVDPNATATVSQINELKLDVEKLKLRTSKVYGVKFTGSNPVGERLGDAIGMVAQVGVDNSVVVNHFDDVPFYNRRICCGVHDVDGKFHINAYRDEPGFAWDGSNGDLFYECKPFWYKGDPLTELYVTGAPQDGYTLAPMFSNGFDKEYLPVFWMAEVGGVATSRSGVHPGSYSLNTGMSEARAYNAQAHTETMAARMSEYFLQLVEFATKDLQTVMQGSSNLPYSSSDTALDTEAASNRVVLETSRAAAFVIGQSIGIGTSAGNGSVAEAVIITAITDIGSGRTAIDFDGPPVDITAGNVVWSRAWVNGATNIVKASSGSPVSNTSGKYPCIWRGKVSPWADVFSAICDMLSVRVGVEGDYSYDPYVLKDPTKYNLGALNEHYEKLNYKISAVNGYATSLGIDDRFPYARITDVVGASSTTHLAAYFYAPNGDNRVVFAGGYWNSGRDCSPVCFHLTFAPSLVNVARAARLFVSRKAGV